MVTRTGSVYHRKDGTWCAALQVLGKRKVAYADSEDGARRQLARLQREYAVTGTLPASGRHTVKSLIDDWLKAATLRPRTKRDYEALTSRYVLPVLGHAKLLKIDGTFAKGNLDATILVGDRKLGRLRGQLVNGRALVCQYSMSILDSGNWSLTKVSP